MTQRIVLVEFIIQEVDRSVTDAGAVGRFISLPARFDEKGSWRVVRQQHPLIEEQEYSKDITLHDHFAAKALQGAASNLELCEFFDIANGRTDKHKVIAKAAYTMAGAMINERNK